MYMIHNLRITIISNISDNYVHVDNIYKNSNIFYSRTLVNLLYSRILL